MARPARNTLNEILESINKEGDIGKGCTTLGIIEDTFRKRLRTARLKLIVSKKYAIIKKET